MSFAGLFVLWVIAVIITGIVLFVRWFFDTGPGVGPVAVSSTGEPPNPGGCDPKKYRTPAQQRDWLVAYCRRVNWERAQYTGSMAKRFPVQPVQLP